MQHELHVCLVGNGPPDALPELRSLPRMWCAEKSVALRAAGVAVQLAVDVGSSVVADVHDLQSEHLDQCERRFVVSGELLVSGKLGRKPFQPDDRDITFKAIVAGQALAKPPANFGHGTLLKDGEDIKVDVDMNGNGPDDTVAKGFQGAGDCVWAAAAHTTRTAAKVNGHMLVITGKESIADYSEFTGYVIGDDQTDQGTDMRQAFKQRKSTGIRDAAGNRHKVAAYVSITPNDPDELAQAAYIFGAIEIGFNFQQAQYDQFDSGVWDYDPSSEIVGGHAIPLYGRNQDRFGVQSWAKHVYVTEAFITNLVEEAWAPIYPEILSKGGTYRGLNLSQLEAALKQLG